MLLHSTLTVIVVCILQYCSAQKVFAPITLSQCGLSKGCLRPSSCSEISCAFVVTWRLVEQNNVNYAEFELKGDVKQPGGYISLAFSRDHRIGDDGVVGCYHNPATASVLIKAAYTDENGRDNTFYPGSDEELLVTEGADLGGVFNALDNTLQCRFRRRVEPLDMKSQLMDLTAPNAYYLIASRGPGVSKGFDRSFAGGESISDQPVVITSPMYGSMTGVAGEGSSIAKTHGCLMVLAWILCASVGVILSRYYKDMWPNSGLLGERVWFQSHVILQSICVSLTCLAIILAFVYCEGYSQTTVYPHYVHPILGLIVFILALINPFMSLCRCHPAHPDRPWFNWFHFFVGTFAHVLSIPTIMLGFRMPAAGLQLASIDYPLQILIFFVIFQFAVELTLEIHGCIYYKRNKNKRHDYELEVEQYQATIRLNGPLHPRPAEPEPSGRTFKYFMLGFHSTVAAIVAVSLVIAIAVN